MTQYSTDPWQKYQQERYDELMENANRGPDPYPIVDTTVNGVPLPTRRETWWGGQMEDRFRLAALESIDGMPEDVDWLLNDWFTLGFSTENVEDTAAMIVLNHTGEGVQSLVDPEKIMQENDIKLADIKDYLSLDVRNTLDYFGYDWQDFESQDFTTSQGLDRIRRDLLGISLAVELENSADTLLEKSTGIAGQFLAGFADSTAVVGLGIASLGKRAGIKALRATAGSAESRTLYNTVVSNTASRFSRNRSVSGAIIDNKFTQNHAAITLGLDAGVTNTLLDLGLQFREGQIFDLYYGDLEETGWWSPGRSLIQFGLGSGLGYTIGKLLRVDASLRTQNETVNKLVEAVGDNLSPAERKAVRAQFEWNYMDPDLSLPILDSDGNVQYRNADLQTTRGMIEDVIDSQLSLYNDGTMIDTPTHGRISRPEYLKMRIVNIIRTMQEGTHIRDVELKAANEKYSEASQRLVDATNQKTRRAAQKDLDEASREIEELTEAVNATNVATGGTRRLQISRTGLESIARENPRLRTLLNREARLRQKIRSIHSRRGDNVRVSKIFDRRLAEAKQELADTVNEIRQYRSIEAQRPRPSLADNPAQDAANIAYRIAEFLRSKPASFAEVEEFLDSFPGSRSELSEIYLNADAAYVAAHNAAIEKGYTPTSPEYASIMDAARITMENRLNKIVGLKDRGKGMDFKLTQAKDMYKMIQDLWVKIEARTLTPEDIDQAIDSLPDEIASRLLGSVGNDPEAVARLLRKDGLRFVAELTSQYNRILKGYIDDTQLALKSIELPDSQAAFGTELDAHRIVPVTHRTHDEARRLLEAIYLEKGPPPVLRTNTIMNRLIFNPVINAVSGWGTFRPEFEQIAREDPMVYNALALVTDGLSNAATVHTKAGNREFVPSLEMTRFRMIRQQKRIHDADKALLNDSASREEFNARRRLALQAAAGVEGKTTKNDGLARKLEDEVRSFYDYWENLGQKTGRVIPDENAYIHVHASPGLHKDPVRASKFKELLTERYAAYLMDQYNPDVEAKDFKFNRAVGVNSKIISRKGDGWIILNAELARNNEKLAGYLDRTLTQSELMEVMTMENLADLRIGGENALTMYRSGYADGIKAEAEKVAYNYVHTADDLKASAGQTNPEAGQVTGATLRAQRADQQRRIPLSIIMSDEILDTGGIILDPSLNSNHYWYSIAGDIALQHNLDRVTGVTGISYDAYVRYALENHRKNNNPRGIRPEAYADIEKRILFARDIIIGRGHMHRKDDSIMDGIITTIGLMTSIPVNAGIGVLMPGTEIAFPALLHTLVTKNHRVKIQAMLDAARSLNKDHRDAVGHTFISSQRAQRVLHDDPNPSSDAVALTRWERFIGPWVDLKAISKGTASPRSFRSPSNSGAGRVMNTVIGSLEAASDTTRFLSGELLWTAWGKGMFGQYHANLAGLQARKIQMAQRLLSEIDNPTERQLRGIARKAGLDFKDFLGYQESGLIDVRNPKDAHLVALADLAEENGTTLGNYNRMIELINNLGDDADASLRLEMAEIYERVIDHTTRQVDRDITNPRVVDRASNASIAASMFHRYLSFARGIRNGRVADLANSSSPDVLAGFTGLMLSEVVTRSISSMIFKGESAEELIQEWEDNPERMILYSLSGVPFAGGGQSILLSLLAAFIDPKQGSRSYVNIPALTIANNQINSLVNVLTAPFSEDKDITDRDVQIIMKSLPGINHPISQLILQKAREGDIE